MIGQTISHYKIIEKLGEGGMGVVYKAQDMKLDRTVALKFLPHHLTSNEAEQARFLQEAKAASALNHPNVCSIHSIGEHEGQSFIDMEFVEGQTLRVKIAGASLKQDDAIGYAIQTGDALHEAHSKGIVHRDIKCENIMINTRNQVKVMDFGLAKLKGSLKLTKASSTVGTLAYMAPEQIQGAEIDGRADIFSFGVVLYEMLTGHMPFRGEHDAAMMYSILNEEPDPLTKYLPEAGSELLHIINRALEKDPEDRYQTVNDMVIDLRRARKDSSKISRRTLSQIPIPQAPPVQEHPTQTKTLLYAGIAAALVAAIIAGVYLFSGKSARDLNPEMTTRVLQVPFTQISYPGLSPDGKWIAFPAADANGKWDIYYMHSQEGNPKRITNDSSDFIQQVADISPDGSRIVYTRLDKQSNKFELLVISSLGGNGKTIAKGGVLARWSPDSRSVGYMKGGNNPYRSESGKFEFWTVGADGQDNRREFVDTTGILRQSRFSWCFSPDGASIGWIRTNDRAFQSIIIHNLATGEERFLVGGDERMDDISWTSNNEIIYSSNKSGNTNLWTIPTNGGTPRQITKGSGPDIGMKVSADGRSLLYLQQQQIGNVWLGSLKTGSARQITFDERQINSPMISPDGRRVAFVMADPDPLKLGSGIYVMNSDGGDRRRITPERDVATFALWSPDGKRIAYRCVETTDSTTAVEIRVIDALNPGTPKTIVRESIVGLWGWMNNNTIVCATFQPINRSYLVSVDDTVRKQLVGDSTIAIPRLGGTYLAYTDFRDTAHIRNEIRRVDGKTLEELLRGPGASITPIFSGNPRSVPRGSMPWASWTFYDELNDFIGIWKNGTEMWKFNFVTGKEEKIAAQFPGFRQGMTAGLSADGTEIVYADQRLSAKLVMIENLFRK